MRSIDKDGSSRDLDGTAVKGDVKTEATTVIFDNSNNESPISNITNTEECQTTVIGVSNNDSVEINIDGETTNSKI